MMEMFWGGLAGAAGLLALFGGIAILMLIDGRNKAQERKLTHAERLKALEMGQPLPDAEVARARADAHRAWASGLAALGVPTVLAGSAVGATALVFVQASPPTHLTLLCVIWGICGLVSLVAVATGLGVLAGSGSSLPQEEGEDKPGRKGLKESGPLASAFRESNRI